MPKYSQLSENIKENILSVIAGSHTRDQLNRLITVAHSLASSFLSSKSTLGTLRSTYGMNLPDLAYDCIADLFQKDEDGNFVQLLSYFKGLPITTEKEEEILAHYRRLVFSKVNQGVYRLYSEADPSLAKIIRNVKISVNILKNYDEVERFGEACIVPCACDRLEHQPAFDRDMLEQGFAAMTTGRELVPELMAKLSLYLREQEECCRILPIVMVALVFRSTFTRRQEITDQATTADPDMVESDTLATIREVCAEIKRKNLTRYVEKGKTSEEMFENYFTVLEEELQERYIGKDGQDFSLYESLNKLSSGMTKDDYSKYHRNVIEYLLKQVDKEARERLKKY